MSEFASVLATADGPLQLYAAPGIDSHGSARAGWEIKGGAEVEWIGEDHSSLTVRYADTAMAKTIRQMLIERDPNRTAMLASIFETRGEDGYVMWYPRTLDELKAISEREESPNIGLSNLLTAAPDLKRCGNADLRGYTHELAALTTIGGNADLRGYTHELAALTTIGGYAYLRPDRKPKKAAKKEIKKTKKVRSKKP